VSESEPGNGLPLRVSTLELFFDLVFARVVPFNLAAALMIIGAGVVKGWAAYVLWARRWPPSSFRR
jgi:low temperature requirement protein LtrA